MGIKVSVDFDADGISKKLNDVKTSKKLGTFLAQEAERGMEPYVPMRTGALVASARTEHFAVEYTASYAKYPYKGKNMTIRTEMHPLATKEWDKAYAKAKGQELGRAATAFLKGM